jgi:hypothetical protein
LIKELEKKQLKKFGCGKGMHRAGILRSAPELKF